MFSFFGSSAKRFTAADAVAMAARGEITLLDVREAGEIAASGTARGGVHIPLAMVQLKANPQGPDHDKRLDPAKPVAVFCAVGGRAGQAAQVLERLGYTAHNIGGFGDWLSAGGAVQR
ncbi:rhodanese-like domain-containing protein [Tabrizicola oligotrophica]|uniref:Sulfurtransferase n=1 Tax=Tabrizicola oligotrophica TaxID=2710650 RepID=A0A6M0QQK1_9RHOB|nr:rhodanese-like domain-containing protein [Tabrizicola oligotrophica]NEY88943.1 sulfurtransferase [Tabrizicola oligotrophica]